MIKFFLASISMLCCLNSAFAAGDQDQAKAQRVSFQDLKEACLNPSRFHNQISPTNIQVTCGEMKHKWVSETDGSMPLQTKRMIMTNIVSNKYSVSPASTEIESHPQEVPCTQYKQLLETVEVAQSTTCEQILAFKGTANEFCLSAIDALRAINPESVKVQETGKKVSFCNWEHQKQEKEQKDEKDQGDIGSKK